MISRVATLLTLFAITACTVNSKPDYFNNRGCNFYGSTFCTAAIGDGIYVSNGPDFFVYNFHFDDQAVLIIYEGDHPQEFGPKDFVKKRIGRTIVKYREYDDGETFHRYYHNEQIGRPTMLHMMSPNKLSESQHHFIDYALSTLTYCRPSGASMICE